MTLTSEKTATKRHAWLVGATTAAMAVALIGVGPIAANAAPTTSGLAFTTGIQSAPGVTTLASAGTTTGTAATGVTTASGVVSIKLAGGAVLNAVVTTPSSVAGLPPTVVTSKFTFTQGDDGTDWTSNVEVAPTAGAAAGNYTLTLTPAGFGSATTGATVQSFAVGDDGNIYLGTTATTGDDAPISLPVNAVKVTLGSLVKADGTTPVTAGSVAFTGDGVSLTKDNGGTALASASSVYVPSGVNYTLTADSAGPDLATANAPFNNTAAGTKVSNPAAATILETVAVPATASAAIVTPNQTASVWKAPTTSPFNDVTTSTQFYNDMAWLSETGISTGYADGGFHPTATIKRNAEAAFLYRLAGSPAVTTAQLNTTFKAFSDVNANTQFATAIAWLYTNGVTTGYSDGTFRPAAEVTRGAMAAFLYRFVNNDTTDTGAGNPTLAKGGVVVAVDAGAANYSLGTFSDVFGATQFSGDIAWLANEGTFSSAGGAITTGYADGSFRSGASIKRNAMAAFIFRLASI